MVCTGKYRGNDTMARAIEASGAEIVTVAVRRVDLDRTKEEGVLYHLDAKRYFLLANTAGCYTAEDADRKSTRLNSSHLGISYAVFCLKKKTVADPVRGDGNKIWFFQIPPTFATPN